MPLAVTKKIVRILFATVGTTALFFAAWKYISIDLLNESLHNLQWRPFCLSFLAYTAVIAVRAIRFILLGANLSFLEAFSVAAIHNAMLRIMPFRSGELAYGFILKRLGKGEFGQGVAAMLMLRLLDFGMISGLTAILAGTYLSSSIGIGQILLVLFFGLSAVFLFFATAPVSRILTQQFLSKRETRNPSLWIWGVRAIRDVLNLSLKTRIMLSVTTAAVWGLVLIWFYYLMLGLGLSLSVSKSFSAGILGVLGSILPLSLVGSFGPFEGGIALGFVAIGLPAHAAATVSVLLSMFTFIHNWILALPGWGWVMIQTYQTASFKNKI